MIKGLVLAGAVGLVALGVVTATGGVDDLRKQLPDIRQPFNQVNGALDGVLDRKRRWNKLVQQADSSCAGHPQGGFVLEPALPPSRRQYARAIGAELDRERAIQTELSALQPPPSYEGSYALFLENRRDALAALGRLQRATKAKNREAYLRAAGELAQKESLIASWAEAFDMPACAF